VAKARFALSQPPLKRDPRCGGSNDPRQAWF
jgi:hypothetical protein